MCVSKGSVINWYTHSLQLYFHSHGSTWLLQFDTLLNASTNTRQLSAVSFILPTNLPHLSEKQAIQILAKWTSKPEQTVIWLLNQSGRVVLVKVVRTWPFLRILARLNFSRCLTRGLRSIFFLFGVSPLFLAICWVDTKLQFNKELRKI